MRSIAPPTFFFFFYLKINVGLGVASILIQQVHYDFGHMLPKLKSGDDTECAKTES